MVKSQNRKGVSKRKVNTQIKIYGEYDENDILLCDCELEFLRYNYKFGQMVHAPARNNTLPWLKIRLPKQKMPEVVHLKIIKKLGTIIDYL